MSILIVEDHPVCAQVLEVNLHHAGYQTVRVATGEEAVLYLHSRPDTPLVITDLLLPAMDGLELCHMMQLHPTWRTIPVIITTALADVETVKRAAHLGCRHYLLKPFGRDRFYIAVRSAVRLTGWSVRATHIAWETICPSKRPITCS